jgi:hypothetical protein
VLKIDANCDRLKEKGGVFMPFHLVLRSLRQNRGLTQEELANATGINRSTLGMYESGRREPNFETLELFADFFNVNMDTLLGRDEQDPSPPSILLRAEKELPPEDLKTLEDMAEFFLNKPQKG